MNDKIVKQQKALAYKMEELVPIVADLAGKYHGIDSTSMSYEKANQLMGAVVFCIQEYSKNQSETMSARQAYERGFDLVKQKTKDTLSLYNEILKNFDSYGNYYLQHTVVAGMPEFFKWYDSRFAPQETLLTLDYNVLKDSEIRKLQGIDAIDAYLKCIDVEQKFLGGINRSFVIQCLEGYDSSYKDMVDNLCLPVLKHLIGCVLLGTRKISSIFSEGDQKKIYDQLNGSDVHQVEAKIQNWLQHFVEGHYEEADSQNINQYLSVAVSDVLVRMRYSCDWEG